MRDGDLSVIAAVSALGPGLFVRGVDVPLVALWPLAVIAIVCGWLAVTRDTRAARRRRRERRGRSSC